jgi:hypothetical protein
MRRESIETTQSKNGKICEILSSTLSTATRVDIKGFNQIHAFHVLQSFLLSADFSDKYSIVTYLGLSTAIQVL